MHFEYEFPRNQKPSKFIGGNQSEPPSGGNLTIHKIDDPIHKKDYLERIKRPEFKREFEFYKRTWFGGR